MLEYLDSVFVRMIELIKMIPFSSATWIVMGILCLFVWIFVRANNDPKNKVEWEDLIIDTKTNKTSPYKMGYLIGLIVATWVIIDYADKSKLTYDLFGIYLAYLLGGAGWVAYLRKSEPDSTAGQRLANQVDYSKGYNVYDDSEEVKPPRS